MGISKEKIQTVIENCFNAECNIATIHDAFERGFRAWMQEDVQPVVHGEWIKTMEGNAFRDKCSECESLYPNAFGYNWCPNCGAKMDKRKGADNEID